MTHSEFPGLLLLSSTRPSESFNDEHQITDETYMNELLEMLNFTNY